MSPSPQSACGEAGVAVCTVIGFPNGYDSTAAKVFQAKDSIEAGADEIDMVINLGWVKDGAYAKVGGEIGKIKEACGDPDSQGHNRNLPPF